MRVLDGNGDPAAAPGIIVTLATVPGTGASGADLEGDVEDATNNNGVANGFAPTIGTSERDYQLKATASGLIGSGPSESFDISDVAKICSGPCSGQTSKGTTSTSISLTSDGGVLTLSLGLDDLDCNDAPNHYYTSTLEPVSWDITSASGRVEVTIRLDSADVNRPYNLYDVCFSSLSTGFRNRYNEKIGPDRRGCSRSARPGWTPSRACSTSGSSMTATWRSRSACCRVIRKARSSQLPPVRPGGPARASHLHVTRVALG